MTGVLPAAPTPALASVLDAARAPEPLCWSGRFVVAVVDVLRAEAPGTFKVDEMPDKTTEYDIGGWDGAIIVHYKGSKYTGDRGGSAAVVQRTFDVEVDVLARGVRGKTGAPNVIEIIRQILQNRQIEGAAGLMPVEDGFVTESGGIWNYKISFRGTLPAVGGRHPRPEQRV